MTNQKFDVLVIGGGVIGLSTAYELSRAGAKVAVIDKGQPGYGCSYGNAGWLTPCFAMPLPMPGMLLKSIGWMLNPESPLYIKPEPSMLLIRWLARFLLSMRRQQMLNSVRALTEISTYSLAAYERMHQETGMDIAFEKKGLLMVTQSKGGLKYAVDEMNFVAEHGVPGKQLTGDELKAFEPSIVGHCEGGVFFPDEAHAEPLKVVKAFAEGALKHGTQIFPNSEVIDFQFTESGHISSVRTTSGIYKADQYVLATGSWSHPIAKSLGLRVPVMGGKGYAIITKPLEPHTPQRPMMLVEKKIAVTPRQGSLRLAGTLELVNGDLGITPRRLDAIIRGSREFMPVPQDLPYTEIWRGLRPCTPDGVPIIGYSKEYENLLVATGHQMLGLQSAPGSGKLASDLILRKTPTFDPHPFRATRF